MAIRLRRFRIRGDELMKLQRLYVDRYRVLDDLDVDFSPSIARDIPLTRRPSYALDFLVGINGTGKSTLLRMLADLMRRLERSAQEPIPYRFELEYDLEEDSKNRRIKISNLLDEDEDIDIRNSVPLKVWENDEQVPLSDSLLPKRVVAFTTGSEEEWQKLEEESPTSGGSLDTWQNLTPSQRAKELSMRELPGKPIKLASSETSQLNTEQLFLLIQAHQLPLLTLCGLLADLAKPQNQRLLEVLEALKIHRVAGFSVKFRKTWNPSYEGDWDDVLKLRDLATQKLWMGTDYLLVFDLATPDNTIPQQIFTPERFSNGLELFRKLAQMATPNKDGQSVLREVSIFIERPPSKHPERMVDNPSLHLLDWFSDGERSFLGRMCLLRLLETSESLILLDEPEVHFNDLWKRRIVEFLDKTLEGSNSHVLVTTHSSITLSDVPREDVIVFDRNANYTSSALNPSIQTFAADPSDIMVHVFGAGLIHPAGESSVGRIKKELDKLADEAPEEKRQALEEMQSAIAQGYWSYRIRRELATVLEE